MKKIVVLYHGNCADGFSGAWAAWKILKNKAEYISVDPRSLPPKKIAGKKVYVIDVGYGKKQLIGLQADGNYVVVIDHHSSAKKDAESANEYLFDDKHSAAVLAWAYFHSGKRLPLLFKHIEDIDLWKFKLPYTREILACLKFIDYDFRGWAKLVHDIEKKKVREKYIEKGKAIVSYQKEQLNMLVKRARIVKFLKYKTLVVNSSVLTSELGNALSKKLPPIGIVWYAARDQIRVSLRSNGKVDVSRLAKKFNGGGGHHDAAGFALPLGSKLPWKVIK